MNNKFYNKKSKQESGAIAGLCFIMVFFIFIIIAAKQIFEVIHNFFQLT